ncbi:MAG: LIC_13387 family protein [Rubrobacteraceae bacterium]
MLATVLMVASAAILLVVGVLHLNGTFFGSDLSPRDPALRKSMRETSPVVTNETDMWRCWIGFNVGFSMGLMLHGLIYGFLAIAHSNLLFGSPYLLVVGLLMAGGFVALSKAYLFSAPFVITGISLACYVAGIIVSLA